MSYNKLVEKLLDFRSLTAEAPDRCEQGSGAAGFGLGVTVGDRENKEEMPSVAPTPNEEAAQREEPVTVGQGQAGRNDGEGMVENRCDESGDGNSTAVGAAASEVDVVRRGIPSARTSARDEGPSSVLRDKAESSATATALREGQVAEDFFRETASQLTYYGLSKLHQEVRELSLASERVFIIGREEVLSLPDMPLDAHTLSQVRERQLCVFFRNNHFSTMFKYEGKLYLLITDLGYARESR